LNVRKKKKLWESSARKKKKKGPDPAWGKGKGKKEVCCLQKKKWPKFYQKRNEGRKRRRG